MQTQVRSVLGLPAIAVVAFALVIAFSTGANAQDSRLSRLWSALRLTETLSIIRDEGHSYALDAAIQLTGQPSDAFWRRSVDAIYDLNKMTAMVQADMGEAMKGRDLAPILNFYESPEGQTVIDLEISARRAYLAPGVDEAAREVWFSGANKGARADAIRRIVADGDLIERNVAGALSSNYAFLSAYSKYGPSDVPLDDQAIFSEVMSEENEVRLDTAEWLYGYLSLAYGPLSDAALAEFAELSDSASGHDLNEVLFLGFDPMFVALAEELGRAAGRALAQQDI